MTVLDEPIDDLRREVLVVTHYYPPHVGGIEQVASAEANGLAQRGSDVTVLTSGSTRRCATSELGSGVRVVRVPALNILERFGVPFPLFAPLALIRRGFSHVRSSAIVHIHDTLYLSSWVAAVCCRLFSRPLVVTQHVAVVAHPWRIVAAVQRLVYRTVGRYIWSTAATVFYLNNGVRDSLLRNGVSADRLAPLVNGVDLDTFAPVDSPVDRDQLRRSLGLPLDRPLVLFVGRLVPKKGYQHLVDAAIGQDRWTAVLAGAGDVVPPHPNVIVLGALDRDRVSAAYQACDLFVLPSESEGFPLTIQEAMASGLPVITNDDPGYAMYGLDRELVSLLPAGGSRLGEAIDRVLDDRPLRARMATYSRDFAEREFSWRAHLDTLITRYDAAIPSASAGKLARNSWFLMASTAATAALGLAFWSAAARLYPVSEIGQATALISAVSLLSYLGLFGLNGSLIRFLPAARDPQRQVSAVLTLVATASAGFGAAYLGLIPLIASRTESVAHGPWFALLFLVIVIGAAVNQATDSVFIAYRVAEWNPVVDGLIQGVAKLIPLALFVSAGALGLLVSFGLGSVAAAAASLVLIRAKLKLRLRATLRATALSGYLSYSTTSYVSSLFNLAPYLALPLITLSRLGSSDAGYYYVAFQIATLLNAISFAVGESMFAESSHAPEDSARLARSSARLIAWVLVPCVVVIVAAAPLVMSVFGASYESHGTGLLRLLAVGSLAVAGNSWTSFRLKIRGSMRLLVATNVAYFVVACGLALVLAAPLGIVGIGIAWVAANVVSTLIALADHDLPFPATRRRLCASFK
jgi:D-inositol-3-phosphate glycosyltransferase